MNYEVSYHDYRELCVLSSKKDEKIERTYLRCVDSLFTNWTHSLGHDKICVLGFILSRTLKYGKLAAAIPFPAFLGGVCSEEQGRAITSALKMSKNTLRNVLKELVEDGFLHVFFPEKRRGVMDTFTRYFEIDFKKLLKLTTKGSSIMAILREPKAKKQASDEAETRIRTPRNAQNSGTYARNSARNARNSGLPNLGDLSTKGYKTPKGVYTADGGKDRLEETTSDESFTKRLTRTIRSTPAQLREKIDATLADMRARRAERAKNAAAKPARGLSQQDVQALFDRAMADYAPDQPRIAVTGKAFGAMRNHLKRSAPADFADFVNWTVRSWATIATRHARHTNMVGKQEGRAVEAIPRAPNFSAFGYRMPYFLTAYNNAKIDNSVFGEQEERQKAAIAKEKRAAEAARQEAASLRALLEKQKRAGTATRRQSSEAPSVSNVPRRPVADDIDIPTWEEQQRKGE